MAARKKLLGKVHPAVISVWAALVAVSAMLPSVPIFGGGVMSVATCLTPLAGVFFGAIPGALAGIGRFIGQMIAPASGGFGMWTFTISLMSGLAAGLTWNGKWWMAPVLCLALVGLWFTHPIGQKVLIFPVIFHGSGFVTSLFSGLVGRKWLAGKNVLLKSIAVFLMCYSGTVIGACLADWYSLLFYSTPAITWKLLAFTAPVERVVFALGSTIIGVPLLYGLPKVGLQVGPAPVEEDDEEE